MPDYVSSPLLTSFVLIFIAELGDKTLFTILLLATRNPPLPVLLGSFAAFLVQGLIAFALGSLLALLPHVWVLWITAAVFGFFGVRLLLTKEEETDGEEAAPKSSHRVAVTAFLMVTAAEWGDASQIGTAALVAHLRAPVQVIAGATLGLWTGTIIAVLAGRMIGTRVPSLWLRRAAGVLFCVFAVVSVVRAL